MLLAPDSPRGGIMTQASILKVTANGTTTSPVVRGAWIMERMLGKHGCVACHRVDKRVLGPSFKEVAAKYAGDSGAAARLAAKIRTGGQGVWGNVPMPPNTGVSESEASTLAGWVLQQK